MQLVRVVHRQREVREERDLLRTSLVGREEWLGFGVGAGARAGGGGSRSERLLGFGGQGPEGKGVGEAGGRSFAKGGVGAGNAGGRVFAEIR